MSQPTFPTELQAAMDSSRKFYWYTARSLACAQNYDRKGLHHVQTRLIEDACTFQKVFRNKRAAIIALAGTHTDDVLSIFEQLPKLPSPQKLLIDLKLGGAA